MRTWHTTAILMAAFTLSGCTRGTVWQAAERNDVESVRLITQWHPDRVDKFDPERGWTPLQWAVANSNGESVYWLLRRGSDPTLASADGRTAYDFANELPNETMRQYILDQFDRAVAAREQAQPTVASVEATQ